MTPARRACRSCRPPGGREDTEINRHAAADAEGGGSIGGPLEALADIGASKLANDLADIDFERTLKLVEERVTEFRHKKLAHHDRGTHAPHSGEPQRVSTLALSELQQLRDAIAEMINALGSGTHYNSLPLDYDRQVIHPRGADPRPDVEVVLDEIARRSRVLNMPEEEPDHWLYQRKRLSPSDLVVINKYRRKFGLREPV